MRKRVLKGLACAIWAAPRAVCANDLLDAYRQAQAQDTTLEADLGATDGFLTRSAATAAPSAVSGGLSADTVRAGTNK